MKKDLKIERLNIAAFGKLSEKDIELDPKINLISAPNEGGKTTLAAFIRFALYGFKGKSQSITDNPKKMYMPWSGAAASGAITMQGDRRIRIERSVVGNKETAQCTDSATGAPLYSADFGEELFGVGCDIFEKTLFLSTAEPPKSKDTELADRLQNLVFSADEQISEEKAEKLLTKHKNALKGRTAGSGRIYQLETDSARLAERLRTERAATEELAVLEAEAAKTAEEILHRQEEEALAEAALKNYEKYEAYELLAERERLAEDAARKSKAAENGSIGLAEIEGLQELKSAFDKAADRRKDKEAEYNELAAEKSGGGAEELARAEAAKAKRKRFKGLLIASLAVFALCLLFKLVCTFVPALNPYSNYALVVAAIAAGSIAGAYGAMSSALKTAGFKTVEELEDAIEEGAQQAELFKLNAARTAAAADAVEEAKTSEAQAKEKLDFALSAYGSTAEDGDAAISELLRQHIEAETLKAQAKSAATALEVFEGRHSVESLKAMAEGAVKPTKEKAQLDIEKKAASQRIAMYKDKLAQIKQRIVAIKAMGYNPLSTAEELSYVQSELVKAKARYDALSIALEELSAAGEEMKSSISPRLASLAGGYFSKLTEGAHISLELDTKLALSCDSPYGQKSGEHLSRGARDGVYICLRMALIDLLFEGRKVPFILDDAFAHIDPPRLKRMIAILAESGHQLIISSCSGREEAALAELGLEYKHINL